jgi:hypothetical protein
VFAIGERIPASSFSATQQVPGVQRSRQFLNATLSNGALLSVTYAYYPVYVLFCHLCCSWCSLQPSTTELDIQGVPVDVPERTLKVRSFLSSAFLVFVQAQLHQFSVSVFDWPFRNVANSFLLSVSKFCRKKKKKIFERI